MEYDVQITRVDGRDLAVTMFHATAETIPEKTGAAFGKVYAYLTAHQVHSDGPGVAQFHMEPDGFAVAVGFVVGEPIDGDGEVVPLRLPAAEVATTAHVGPYAELPKAYEALAEGARAEGRELDQSAAMWEEYWSPPETPPEQTRTVVYWPLKQQS